MTRVLLGVDTEADNQWDAAARENPTMRNIAELPRLQSLCDEYGVRPTYVVTYEVATDPESRAVLGNLAATGRSEIGTHHHPWTTPPRVDGHLYPLNLTSEHYREQLETRVAVFASERGIETVAVPLQPQEIQAVRRIAESQGVDYVALIQGWVLEKLHSS